MPVRELRLGHESDPSHAKDKDKLLQPISTNAHHTFIITYMHLKDSFIQRAVGPITGPVEVMYERLDVKAGDPC